MGVGVAQDSEGKLHTIIGTSEPRGYLRPGVTLNDGEIMAVGTGHAEVDILNHAKSNGWTLLGVGTTRPACPNCQDALDTANVPIFTPRK